MTYELAYQIADRVAELAKKSYTDNEGTGDLAWFVVGWLKSALTNEILLSGHNKSIYTTQKSEEEEDIAN